MKSLYFRVLLESQALLTLASHSEGEAATPSRTNDVGEGDAPRRGSRRFGFSARSIEEALSRSSRESKGGCETSTNGTLARLAAWVHAGYTGLGTAPTRKGLVLYTVEDR